MKNKLISVAAILLLFLPTYIAIAYYISAQDATVDTKVVSKMDISDTNSKVYNFDKKSRSETDNIEDNMVDFFIEMNSNAKAETSIPDQLIGSDYFKVTYYAFDREFTYKYYFTRDPNEAYYIDDSGSSFRIQKEDASKFLLSKYARSLYPESDSPALSLSGNISVEPTTMKWEYLNCLGEYMTSNEISNTVAPVATYNIKGGFLNLSFTKDPDYLSVKITENGEVIFNDLYENIGNVNLNEESTINVTLEAKWYNSSETGYGGEAMYNFYGEVEAQPIFYLGETSIEPGEFVVLSGLNITSIDDIKFTSEPSINFNPVFFADGKYVRALIPIAFDLPEVVEMCTNKTANEVLNYTFTIEASGVHQSITLNVTDKTFRTQQYDIAEDIAIVKRNDTTVDAFKQAMQMSYASREAEGYFSDDRSFLQQYPDSSIRSGFGIYRNVTSTKETYRHLGVDFIVGSTDSVLAMAAGKVIYVGEQVLSGKIIVIDHGWGLKSTYCHLSSASIKEGEIVAKGAAIGTVGATGFTNGVALHVGFSVFNIPVCPYPLWGNGLIMTMLSTDQE